MKIARIFFMLILINLIYTIGYTQSMDEFLEEGKTFLKNKKYTEAKKFIDRNAPAYYADYQFLCFAAECYYTYGQNLLTNQLPIYEKGYEYANKAVLLNPQHSLGYFWRATLIGSILQYKLFLEINFEIRRIAGDAEKAIQLNNAGKEILSRSYYIIGRIHLELCSTTVILRLPIGLAWGNLNDAAKYLKQSLDVMPSIKANFDYARMLMMSNKSEEALPYLEAVFELSINEINDDKLKVEAEKIYNEIDKKPQRISPSIPY